MRSIARRLLMPVVPLLALAFAGCSDTSGPGGPEGSLPPGMSRISGQLTATEGAAASQGARGLGLAADQELAGVQVTILDGTGTEIFSTTTDLEGEFEGTVPAGTYTVLLELDPENVFSFSFDVPEGSTFFVEGKVDVNPSGRFKLDAEIFVDNDGDTEPDSSFRIRITGRLAGQPQSGDVDISGHGDKVAVCHFPPGNPDNFHTIVVGAGAVGAHLAHGDTEGPCEDSDLVDDDDGDGDGDDVEDEEEGEKAVICHVPPGNPENAHTLSISPDDVQVHLDHGDTEGACAQDAGGDSAGA